MKELTRAVIELGLCSVLVNGCSNLGADKLYLDEDQFMRALKHTRRRIAALVGRDGPLRARQRRNHHRQRAPKSGIVLVHGAWADSSSSVTDPPSWACNSSSPR